jgi:hypothetical protein
MAKKPKTIKIPKEEMDTLNDIRGEYSSIQLRLGEIELLRTQKERHNLLTHFQKNMDLAI